MVIYMEIKFSPNILETQWSAERRAVNVAELSLGNVCYLLQLEFE